MSEFNDNLAAIQTSARSHLADGPVTTTYGADVAAVITVLNDVLATEIVCWLRYQQHAIVAAGVNSASVVSEFAEHAGEELQHAVSIAERIDELGGTPDLDPAGLVSRSRTEYRTFRDVDIEGMLIENLVAERIVIQIYRDIIKWLGDGDPTTRRLIERILESEEEHASDLVDLLGDAALEVR